MQHTQYNFVRLCARMALVAGVILAANPAEAGPITRASKPDPLLDGGETSACMAGPDLASGTDATGQPVVPADVGNPPVPVPDEIMVPVGRQAQNQAAGRGRNPVTSTGEGVYAGFDGRRMAPLLHPKPCR